MVVPYYCLYCTSVLSLLHPGFVASLGWDHPCWRATSFPFSKKCNSLCDPSITIPQEQREWVHTCILKYMWKEWGKPFTSATLQLSTPPFFPRTELHPADYLERDFVCERERKREKEITGVCVQGKSVSGHYPSKETSRFFPLVSWTRRIAWLDAEQILLFCYHTSFFLAAKWGRGRVSCLKIIG